MAHGLKWFRRWKDPETSDWEAFRRQLKFPLSPSRAKGGVLNVEGRRAAGFDANFIDELNVHSQSKGRTPNVFVFNPFAEGYLARGKSFSPVKHQVLLAEDLANLPQFLGRQDDIVLLPKRPAVQFLSGIKQAGFALPEFVELESASRVLVERKLGTLRPWAWAPDSVELLAPFFDSVTGEVRTPNQRFNEGLARLYSKAWSAEFLKSVLARAGSAACETWLCTENEAGVAVQTLNEALEAIAAVRARGHHRIVVKEALGLAGHNAIRLWEPELLETQRRWLANAAENGRLLVVEPWLERELDFSIQLEMGPRGLKLCGYTGLLNDRQGRFIANRAAADYTRRISADVTALFPEPTGISSRFQRLYEDIFSQLETELKRADFVGPIGIDAFVYRIPEGLCRLKPMVEINPRYTMGRVTVELMKQTCPGSHGLFRLVNRAQARAEGFESFPAYARALSERFPLRLEGQPVPKIREGAVCLNDPAQAQVCLAVFQVSARSGPRASTSVDHVGGF